MRNLTCAVHQAAWAGMFTQTTRVTMCKSYRMCNSKLATLAVLDGVSLSHNWVWCNAYNCLQHAGSDVDVSEMSVA